jgi:hypothetical protein
MVKKKPRVKTRGRKPKPTAMKQYLIADPTGYGCILFDLHQIMPVTRTIPLLII